jgi:hypothetical protein
MYLFCTESGDRSAWPSPQGLRPHRPHKGPGANTSFRLADSSLAMRVFAAAAAISAILSGATFLAVYHEAGTVSWSRSGRGVPLRHLDSLCAISHLCLTRGKTLTKTLTATVRLGHDKGEVNFERLTAEQLSQKWPSDFDSPKAAIVGEESARPEQHTPIRQPRRKSGFVSSWKHLHLSVPRPSVHPHERTRKTESHRGLWPSHRPSVDEVNHPCRFVTYKKARSLSMKPPNTKSLSLALTVLLFATAHRCYLAFTMVSRAFQNSNFGFTFVRPGMLFTTHPSSNFISSEEVTETSPCFRSLLSTPFRQEDPSHCLSGRLLGHLVGGLLPGRASRWCVPFFGTVIFSVRSSSATDVIRAIELNPEEIIPVIPMILARISAPERITGDHVRDR